MITQDEGMRMLCILCAQLQVELQEVAPSLDFAVAFWSRGEDRNPFAVSLFAPPHAQAVAPTAAITAAFATMAAAGGLDVTRVDAIWAEVRARLIATSGEPQA